MKLRLPINANRDEIIETVRNSQVTIVAGETGSGKTTQVPQYLRDAGLLKNGKTMGITQPRRVAAIGVAMFVAEQTGCAVGNEVGYQIRHDNMTSEKTDVKFMTDGILLRELLADPLLKRYGVLILDEVHERNLNQDVIMALVKDLLPWRPDLKVILMSATIDERRFARYFDAPIVLIKGRMYPVEMKYLGAESDYAKQAVRAVRTALTETDGDVLVFMPDYRSIQRTVTGVEATCPNVDVLPLFGNQSPEDQKRIFNRTGRSVIVATNIAETSITLDGVTAVVDTGRIKQMTYLPDASISSLQVTPHSQAGCEQRAGRAGRTRPGICYRLYDENDLLNRPAFTEPEIRRSSLEQVLLQLKAMGFSDDDIRAFDFMDAPPRIAWREAEEHLRMLGALGPKGKLSEDGMFMSRLPLPPMVSRMLLTARRYRCVGAVSTIAATFATRPIFVYPKDEEAEARDAHEQFKNTRSDFLTSLNAIEAWRRAEDREAFAKSHYLHHVALEEIDATEMQIVELLDDNGITVGHRRNEHHMAMAIASGLTPNILVRTRGGTYKSRKFQGVHVSPGSALFGKGEHRYLVASDIIETNRVYARNVQSVREEWLSEILSTTPNDPELQRLLYGDKKRKKRGKRDAQPRTRRRNKRHH